MESSYELKWKLWEWLMNSLSIHRGHESESAESLAQPPKIGFQVKLFLERRAAGKQ